MFVSSYFHLAGWMVAVLADGRSSFRTFCLHCDGSSSNCKGLVQPGRRKLCALLTKSLADWSSGRETVTVASMGGKSCIVEAPGT